jgi:hypothetical protein
LKKFKFCYRNKDICKRLCFDNNVVVPYVSNFDDVDIVIRFGYEKLSLLDIPCINIYFDKIDKLIKTIKVEDIILEGNNDIQKMFGNTFIKYRVGYKKNQQKNDICYNYKIITNKRINQDFPSSLSAYM